MTRPTFRWAPTIAGPWAVILGAILIFAGSNDPDAGVGPYVAWLVAGLGPLAISFWGSYGAWRNTMRAWEGRVEAEKAREAKREHEDRQAQERARVEAGRRQLELCVTAAEVFTTLPAHLSHAGQAHRAAEGHFENGAFSPFWSSIESAYQHLGLYSQALDLIAQKSRTFAQARRADPSVAGPDRFSITVDHAGATEAYDGLVSRLGDTVYLAQRQVVFAQIWEQRRTTRAVVEGFQTLEAAVDRMGHTISNSIQALRSGITASLHSVAAAADASRSASLRHATSVERLTETQVALLRQSSEAAREAAHTLHLMHRHSRWGY